MSKFSSYKQSQLLFENWRKHVNEGEEQLGLPLGKGKPEVVARPGGSLEAIKSAVEEYRKANVPEGDEYLQYNVGSVLDDIMRSVQELERMEGLSSEEEELDEQSELPTEASDILDDLKGAEEENPKAFNMALGALSKKEGV